MGWQDAGPTRGAWLGEAGDGYSWGDGTVGFVGEEVNFIDNAADAGLLRCGSSVSPFVSIRIQGVNFTGPKAPLLLRFIN
ncbi:MAG TPA: hypothetical protein VGF19_03510, partial [Candidatus Acidoferrum sp.]